MAIKSILFEILQCKVYNVKADLLLSFFIHKFLGLATFSPLTLNNLQQKETTWKIFISA